MREKNIKESSVVKLSWLTSRLQVIDGEIRALNYALKNRGIGAYGNDVHLIRLEETRKHYTKLFDDEVALQKKMYGVKQDWTVLGVKNSSNENPRIVIDENPRTVSARELSELFDDPDLESPEECAYGVGMGCGF